MIIPVIMAGGAGTRLWPMSNEEKPKQFHNMSGGGTLLEETINRLKPVSPEEIVIVSAKKYEQLSLAEVKKSGLKGAILSEPMPRNTAAAVLYAAMFLKKRYRDAVMIVLPADHFIRNNAEFISVINNAVSLAANDNLVTIGIKPEYPETGYGYIKASASGNGPSPVDRFVEKPDIERAKEYVADGSYFWNSGIFVWKVSAILEKFRELLPDMYAQFLKLESLTPEEIVADSHDVWQLKERIFSAIQSISIDNGILEHSTGRMVIPAEFGWADLGSWKAADDVLDPDEFHNRTQFPENAIFVKSANCTIMSEGMRIAVVGVSNLVVVQSGNDVLVIDKDSAQEVRKVVDIVKGKKE